MISGSSSFYCLMIVISRASLRMINFFEMMLRASSLARDSAVKMELSIGRAFLENNFIENSCVRCFIVVLRAIHEDISVVGMALEDIAKHLISVPSWLGLKITQTASLQRDKTPAYFQMAHVKI